MSPQREASGGTVQEARSLLEANGFVVLREKSYRQAQERQRIAEALMRDANEQRADTEAWARGDLLGRERHLSDRCTFLYGAARAHGATVEELRDDAWLSPVPTGEGTGA